MRYMFTCAELVVSSRALVHRAVWLGTSHMQPADHTYLGEERHARLAACATG